MAVSTATLKLVMKAQDDASGVLGKVGGSLGKIGAVAAGAVVAGLTAAGFAAVKLVKDAAPIINIEKAFDGIAEAAGTSGDAMLDALEKGSAGLITQTDLMKQYNLAAQLVSKEFATDALPAAMEMVGKVAAATGEDIGFLMDSLVRGIGRLSPMILDNLGIQVDLNKAYEDYAKKLGITTSELSKQEQQAALTEQVMELLGENTAALPDLAGTAAASFVELNVIFQNVAATVGKILVPMFEPLLDKIVETARGFENLFEVIEEAGLVSIEAREALGDIIGDDAAKQVLIFAKHVIELYEAIKTMGFWSEGTREKLKLLFNDEIVDSVFKFKEAYDALRPEFEKFSKVFQVFFDYFDFAAPLGIDGFMELGISLGLFGDEISDTDFSAWSRMLDNLQKIIGYLRSIAGINLAAIIGFISGLNAVLEGLITGDISDFDSAMFTFIEGFVDGARGFIDEVNEALLGDKGSVKSFSKGVEDEFIELDKTLNDPGGVMDDITSGVVEGFEELERRTVGESIIPEMVDKIIQTFLTPDWISVGLSMIDGITTGILMGSDALAQAAFEAAAGAMQAAQDAIDQATEGSDTPPLADVVIDEFAFVWT